MKKTIYFLLISLLFTNCTHRIVRTGYQASKSDYKDCDVVIGSAVAGAILGFLLFQ